MIALRSVALRYRKGADRAEALSGVHLSVARGEFVAVVGASGSGKTSILGLIGGLIRPTSGDVEIDSRSLAPFSSDELAHLRLTSIGIVFQENNLIPELTVQENVELPLRLRAFPPRYCSDESAERIADVALDPFAARMPHELSGGQRQRVGIARAMAGGRRILLADEPTGALDTDNARAIFEQFRGIADKGVTVVVASHDALVDTYADRVVTVREGRIQEWAAHPR